MSLNRQTDLNVEFLGCSKDPVEIFYSAYLQTRSTSPPAQIWKNIKERKIDYQSMRSCLKKTMPDAQFVAHSQVYFVFVLNNISTYFLNRLTRQRLGLECDEEICPSPAFMELDKPFLTPPDFKKDRSILSQWNRIQNAIISFYQECLQKGIRDEDARLVVPEAAVSRKQVSLSYRMMQHFLDQSMCHEEYWEANVIAWQIYQIITVEFPTLAEKLGIKCWENRNLYCDQSLKSYSTCRYSDSRPHKSNLTDFFETGTSSIASLER